MRGFTERSGAIGLGVLLLGCHPLTGPTAPATPPPRRLAINGPVTCVVDERGVTDCWGPPERLPSALRELEPVRALALAGAIGCAVGKDGRVWCWSPRGGPPREVPGLADVRDLDLAGDRGCAVLGSRGRVACWSMSDEGPRPAELSTRIVDAVQVEITRDESCARLSSGSVRCWKQGEKSYRTNLERAADFAIDPYPWSTVIDEWFVTTDGRVLEQLSSRVEDIDDAREIEVGGYGYCVRRATGKVACWSKVGTGLEGLAIEIEGIDDATELAVGHDRACARGASGEIRCWGPGIDPAPAAVGEWQDSPVRISGLPAIEQVSVGAAHVCALPRGGFGGYWCWGRHSAFMGYLSHVQIWNRVAPVHEYMGGTPDAIFAGDGHTWLLHRSHERLKSVGWGSDPASREMYVPDDSSLGIDVHERWGCSWFNDRLGCFGEIGYFDEARADSRASLQPTPVASFRGPILDAAVGHAHACALLDDASVWCWGRDNAGQRGGAPTYRTQSPAELGTPTRVEGLPPLQVIDAGDLHSCGLGHRGEVWCWGANDQAQLGVEDPLARIVQVPGLPPLTSLSVGARHGCGLDDEAGVWCWGLGRAPARIRVAVPIVSLDTGGRSTCGVDEDGGVWCWGDNRYGQSNPSSALGSEHAVPLDPQQRVRIVARE